MLSCTQGKASTIIICLVRFPNADSMSTIAARDADLMMSRGIKIKSAISERESLPSIIGRKEKRGGKKRMKEKKIGDRRRNGGTTREGAGGATVHMYVGALSIHLIQPHYLHVL